MASSSIAAVLRAGIFSPNHIANDAAILHLAAEELRKRGHHVRVYSEREFLEADISEDIVLSMGRMRETTDKLRRLEDEGRMVLNSGYGVENCVRMVRIPLLRDAGVPIPETYIVDTNVGVERRLKNGGFGHCWVKRADAHTHHLEDSARCRHPQEAQEILHEFFFRGIRKAAVSRHVDGEIIKFYGVSPAGWFHCFMPLDNDERGREGLTEISDRARNLAKLAADALGIDIYGGDMVLDRDGNILLVDIDDWPSFAPCRREAARAVAKSVVKKIQLTSGRRRSSR